MRNFIPQQVTDKKQKKNSLFLKMFISFLTSILVVTFVNITYRQFHNYNHLKTREVNESIWIRKEPNCLNRDGAAYSIPTAMTVFWSRAQHHVTTILMKLASETLQLYCVPKHETCHICIVYDVVMKR